MNTLDIGSLNLRRGSNKPNAAGAMCVMEAVSFVAGEPWSDSPACSSPVLSNFLRNLNDAMDDNARQLLRPLIPKIVGTNTGAADDQTRGLMAADWLVRVYTPSWLDLAKLNAHAKALRESPEITSWDALVAITPTLIVARDKAAAARAAARAAAWAAARAAAGDAARDDAWDAARAAAGDAARAAAWDAAWAAAGAAAWDAAWDAAWAAARAAAWDAARAAAGAAAWDAARDAAWDAAGAAVGDALKPTVSALQASAIALAERMAAVGRKP